METQESTLDKIRNRPRFKMIAKTTPEVYAKALNDYLVKNQEAFSGNVNKEAATIFVQTKEDAFWKPRLSLRTELEDQHTMIRGVFGPSAAVWTFFMFLYFILTVLSMVFFTLYFVEKQIESHAYPWSLYAAIGTLLAIGLVYLSARIGQYKAREEMGKLRQFAIETTLPFE